MFFKSQKVKSKTTQANSFFPSHVFDQSNYPSNFSKTDKVSNDLIFNSPLLNLLLNNNTNNFTVNASEKDILLKAWKSSVIIEGNSADKIKISDSLNQKELNILKAKGLIAGSGSEVSLTPVGKKTLVETILDAKSSLRKTANSNFIKIAQKTNLDQGVEKIKIVRDSEGRWITKKEKELPSPTPENRDIDSKLENQSLASLINMYKEVKLAQKDCFKYRQAGSSVWDNKYDYNKLYALNQKIREAIEVSAQQQALSRELNIHPEFKLGLQATISNLVNNWIRNNSVQVEQLDKTFWSMFIKTCASYFSIFFQKSVDQIAKLDLNIFTQEQIDEEFNKAHQEAIRAGMNSIFETFGDEVEESLLQQIEVAASNLIQDVLPKQWRN